MAQRNPYPGFQDDQKVQDPEVFEQYQPTGWKVGSRRKLIFPVEQIQEGRAKRIVKHERPHRPGAKLDDTDWEARTWILTCSFNNTIEEEGIPISPPLYPNVLNELIRSFDEKETGDLELPTRGIKRCRAHRYDRVESSDARDEARAVFTFIEDSEDDVDQDAFQDPSVRAQAVRLSEQAVFSAQSAGAWDDDLVSVTEFASQLEGLLLAPGRSIQNIESVSRRNRRAIQRIIRAQRQLGRDVGGLFYETEGAHAERQLVDLLDLQASAVAEATADRPKTQLYNVQEDTDIFSIAASLGQDPIELLELNAARIEDPLDLRAGDSIRVYTG